MLRSKHLILFFCLSSSALFSTDYFVSNSGNDSQNGLSLATAFATLQHAADLITAGDNVFVADGEYVGFALYSGGTESDPIVFKALGNNVLINVAGPTNDGINIENANYITLDGFIVNDQPRNGIRLALANHCVVANCKCDNNFERGIFTAFTDDILIEYNVCTNSIDEHGIYVSNSSDRAVIRYNECYGNNNIGIHMNGDLSEGGDGIISGSQIYGNYIHDNNMAAGINLDGVENALIYNNIIVNNHFGQGIAMFQQDGAVVSSGARIYNNVIIVPDDGRWGILLQDGANIGTEIYNNIIITQHAWRGSISCESIIGIESNYNILSNSMSNQGDGLSITLALWQALGLDGDSREADPLPDIFTAPANSDFHLLSDAQAVDAGNANLVSSIVMTDYDGNIRPEGVEYDIGAFEYIGPITTTAYHLEIDSIELFPNPTEGNLWVEGDFQDYSIEIVDITGQIKMLLTGASSPVNLNLESLGSGVYFLNISNTNFSRLSVFTVIKR